MYKSEAADSREDSDDHHGVVMTESSRMLVSFVYLVHFLDYQEVGEDHYEDPTDKGMTM